MTEANQFTLPDVGEGLTEAEVVTWHVKPGDTVNVNDTLVEVETAKSLVELPSPYAGVIAALHADEGETVEVGEVLVSYGVADEVVYKSSLALPAKGVQAEALDDSAALDSDSAPVDEPQQERQSVLVGYGPSKAKVARSPRRAGFDVRSLYGSQSKSVTGPHATPPVRFHAKELGVDLSSITASRSDGRITRGDLDRFVATTHPSASAGESVPEEVRVPIKGVRKATAAAVESSAFTAPHVTEWVTVDVTETLGLLAQLKADKSFANARLTPLVLIARAVLSALRNYPDMNAKWDSATNEIVRYRDVNLGIAAATPRGLLVPNIKAAQTLSALELCDQLASLVHTARDGKTQPEEMSRGTFTITNVGVFGIDGATPILNPGEAGILGVGQIARRPWEHRGEIALRSVCTLSLSFDHRLVDGQLGSNVLGHIAQLLSQPALAFVL